LSELKIIKSKRITSHNLTNNGKEKIIQKVFSEIHQVKRIIANKFNQSHYQDLLFKNKFTSGLWKEFKSPILLAWEVQKFVNQDLLEKDLERLERKVKSFKYKLFNIELNQNPKKTKRIRRKSNLGKLLEKLIQYEYLQYRSKSTNKYLISLNNDINIGLDLLKDNIKSKLLKLKDIIIFKIKFKKKAINYTTGSIIKIPQKELGIKPRIIKDISNSLFKYFYCFDYRDSSDNFKKKTINIPLAYNEKFHGNLEQYANSISKNKYSKKLKLKNYIFSITSNKSKILLNNPIKNIKKKKLNYIFKKNKQNKIITNNLLEVEHTISFSKNSKRLNISLTYQSEINFKKQNKMIGIDIGGKINNTIATSEDKFIGFKHLKTIIKKLNKIETNEKYSKQITEIKELKAKRLAKVYRENFSKIINEVSDFLKECNKNKITDIVMEDLNVFSTLGKRKSKELDEKHNRVFRLLRMSGLVEIFRKIARNLGIRIHTIPSYYTSKWCRICNCIDNNNRKKDNDRLFCCIDCNHTDDSDFNASKNILEIFKRFLNDFCDINKFGEYSAKKYLTKEFVKNKLSGKL
jgi:transposase